MKETWYVVPAAAAFGRGGDDSQDEPPLLFMHPGAGSVWPRARALPRRVKGFEKK